MCFLKKSELYNIVQLLPEKIVLKLTMCFPVSFQEYKVRLSDKASRGQFVAAVRATDADQNSKLTYGIIGKTHYHFTKLNPKKRALSNFVFQYCKEFGTQCKKNFSDPPRDS